MYSVLCNMHYDMNTSSFSIEWWLTHFQTYISALCSTLCLDCVKYWMAITTRFLLGALNGFLAPVKVLCFLIKKGTLLHKNCQFLKESRGIMSVSLFAQISASQYCNCCFLTFCYVQAYSIEVCQPEQQALGISIVSSNCTYKHITFCTYDIIIAY
jgi:hypothetical protein